jgi:hypothetical protein
MFSESAGEDLSITNDSFSSELLNALDKLTNDINRKVLQVLLDSGETDTRKLHDILEEHRGISYLVFMTKLHLMEKDCLIECTMSDESGSAKKVRLSKFGATLLHNLLDAQKLLELTN